MIALFSLAIFVSACLLFLIQPMFPKKLLPLLGGTAIVWNTCIFFYQTALLAGYAYTHFITKRLQPRHQGLLHVGLIVGAAVYLPFGIESLQQAVPSGNPVIWILSTIAISVGLPFFALSATAPMVQQWLTKTRHASARDPYFLYSISNTGSMVALLAYPFLIEPRVSYALQLEWWARGYWVFALLMASCAVLLHLGTKGKAGEPDVSAASMPTEQPPSPRPSMQDRFWWVMLSFLPSSLLLGITSYLTGNIVAVPLLWVLPLAAYLLAFILVFSRRRIEAGKITFALQTILILMAGIVELINTDLKHSITVTGAIAFQLLLFFTNAFACTSALSKRRPQAEHLTEFYLYLSIGGALGGIFNALLAPILFDHIVEYPIVLVLSYLLSRYALDKSRFYLKNPLEYAVPIILAAALFYLFKMTNLMSGVSGLNVTHRLLLGIAVFILLFSRRPLCFGLSIAVLLTFGILTDDSYKQRNYFGVYSIVTDQATQETVLYNGRISHGMQMMDPALRTEPQLYFARKSPFGLIYSAIRAKRDVHAVAVVGLGAGTLAAYGETGQHWVFYDIDPLVIDIAKNSFTYISDSHAKIDLVTGDGRLSLTQAPDGYYDLIVIDAFSGDSVPVHMITREAYKTFSSKLAPDGVIMYHISNIYLSLARPLRKLAEVERADSLYCKDNISEWFAISKNADGFASIGNIPSCRKIQARPNAPLWTDDFSSLYSVFR